MRERGVAATGLTDLLEHSKTARASIYQHFPEGKAELMEQATLHAGGQIGARIDALAAAHAPAEVVIRFVDGWKEILEASSYTAGCPVVAASQTSADWPTIQAASATVFADWTAKLADAIAATGADRTAAASLGSVIVSTIEGAIIQCRSAKSLRPLDDARTNLVKLLDSVSASPSASAPAMRTSPQ